MIYKKIIWVFYLKLLAVGLFAQNHSAVPTMDTLVHPTDTLHIGLALSGGGAKGLAHIGVLQVLEEAGIYPDAISGTSMGSIVGGLYAIGYTADELAELAIGLPWDEYLTDQSARRDLPLVERSANERYQLTFTLKNGKLQLPRGLIQGTKLELLLAELTMRAHAIESFDDFDIPFRAVALDLETGEAVTFSEGSLSHAIRASMSIPSVFEPVEYEDKLLADGGWIRNLPVTDLDSMGANFYLASDVGEPLSAKEEILSPADVLMQISGYPNYHVNLKQRKLADQIIEPSTKDLNATDFQEAKEWIRRGQAAAKAQLPQIKSALRARGWTPEIDREPGRIQKKYYTIKEMSCKDLEGAGLNTLTRLCAVDSNMRLDRESLRNKFNQLYASKLYHKLDFEMIPVDSIYKLKIFAEENKGSLLRFGVGYHSDFRAGLLFNLTTRSALLHGSRLSVDVRLNEWPAMIAEYLISTKNYPSAGFRLNTKLVNYPSKFTADFRLLDEFNIWHSEVEADLFTSLSRYNYFSVGLSLDRYVQRRSSSLAPRPIERYTQFSIKSRLLRDTYDDAYFPQRGIKLELSGQYVLGGEYDRTFRAETTTQSAPLGGRVRAVVSPIWKLGNRTSLGWLNEGGIVRLDEFATLYDLFYLGREVAYSDRHASFVGLQYAEQPVDTYISTALRLQQRVGNEFYLSGLVQYGFANLNNFTLYNGDQPDSFPKYSSTLTGVGAELAYNSPLGPLRWNVEYSVNTRKLHAFLRLGYQF